MADDDTWVWLNGHGVRRSAFGADSFDFGLSASERGILPADLLKQAMAPLIELIGQPGGWDAIVERYDHCSLLGFLLGRGVSDPAVKLLGPLFNLEGRYHFSLVEWFSHWHENVFGNLECIVAGSDTRANAFGPLLLDDTRLGAEVHAVHQGP